VPIAHVTIAQFNGCDKCTNKDGPRSPELDRQGSSKSDWASPKHNH
jgi:hypothetical protein